MKKISIFLAAATLITVTGYSQVRVGLQAGGHLASAKSEVDGVEQDGSKSLFGYKIGGIVQVGISDQISFMPELNFIAKGGKFESSTVTDFGFGKTTIAINGDVKPYFVEVPLNIAYTASSEDGSGFFAGLGPVISLGLGGKTNSTITTTIEATGFPTQTTTATDNADIKFDGKKDATDDKAHLKGLEFGGNVFAGYRLSNGVFVKASYNMGFSNLSPEDKTSFKTSYFGLSVGYFFGQSN